ncbi:Magnesium and cobalt efflux protein CorC [Lacunisphaera limnophila]|uniref:Magnesium and cobalt efflux protein CorC n=1 Tax=Lacunisphaera limnophila TaxID=1838286 RepID=A0A1D8ATZ5_9BACT|nr:hemolysin family protein [Lacunisphaera limnophila]AOS44365.1 Magnesium and cobalt efflux protein CorC [Lacunisphaera limnophila]
MNSLLGFTLEILIILGLVVANGFFVAAEFALVKVRASQLRPLAKKGRAGWRLRMALKATQHLDSALSATQLGITLSSLGLGWVGEPFLAHRLEPMLANFGVTDPAAVSSIAFAIAFAIITFLHIVFGELAPKSLAIQRPKGVSLWTAGPLMFFYYLFLPFIWVLNGTANRFLRWAGLGPATEGEHAFSAEELEYVFSHARHTHPGDAAINKLMVQSLRARSTQAQQIMRPRDQVIALWSDKPLAENLRTAQISGHSRFPVCTGSLDEVKGLLLIREWLWQISLLGPDTPFEPLVRPVVEFELTTPLHTMIERFRLSRSHLAVVLDPERKLAGIITFEDVLEEIVGDIRDEFDIESGPIYERTEHAIVVTGAFTLRELQAETGWPLEGQPRETVAIWVQRLAGAGVPKRGDQFAAGEYRLTVLEANAERARRVRVARNVGEGTTPPM